MDFSELSEAEIVAIATPIMDNLMEASMRIDHGAHTRDFTPRLKAIVTEEHLQRVCTKVQAEKGLFGERRLVAVFRRPDSAALVWRQTFSKVAGEYVAEMVLVHRGGEYLCDHAMVF